MWPRPGPRACPVGKAGPQGLKFEHSPPCVRAFERVKDSRSLATPAKAGAHGAVVRTFPDREDIAMVWEIRDCRAMGPGHRRDGKGILIIPALMPISSHAVSRECAFLRILGS